MLLLGRERALRMRYLIKYTKEGYVKFVAHLDLMRTMQRIIRRSDIPVEFSKGFNPHILLSIAQPLSVGMSSRGDYMDLMLLEEMPEEEILDRLNEVACTGIEFLDACKIDESSKKKAPQAMALIDEAKYTIKIKCNNEKKAVEEIDQLVKSDNWEILKKTKKSEKIVNIKHSIKEFKYWSKDERIVVNIICSCGSRENLSSKLVAEYLVKNCESLIEDSFIDITREEMYAYVNDKTIPLCNYYR